MTLRRVWLPLTMVALFAMTLGCPGRETESPPGKEAHSLVGTWRSVRLEGADLPEGSSMQMTFSPQGRFTMTGQGKVAGQVKTHTQEGSYRVDGDRLIVKVDGKEGPSRFWFEDEKLVIEHLKVHNRVYFERLDN